jgi:phenylalanyl-tRNA synthetase alpha chain
MKMYIKPISKTDLQSYLAIPDLTNSKNHAIQLVYEKIKQKIETTHTTSDIRVCRKDPIVSTEDNYDNLLIASDNISRSSTYTHYVDTTHILRTHTSAHMPSILRELSQSTDSWNDVVVLLPGLAYRRDVSDKKHVAQVHMLEMWRIVKNSSHSKITKTDLLQVVEAVAETAAPGWQLRIIDSPHPYTQQGIEVNAVLGDRDIEILECGLISDEILARSGLDPSLYSGWAMGMGLDRLVMTLKNIPDIRYLRSTNPKIAEQMTHLAAYREVSHQPAICRDMSYSVPQNYVEEDISEDIRKSLAKDGDVLESVQLLTETPYALLPPVARERLGCQKDQKNVLVRITLRHLVHSITNSQANDLYERVYRYVNKGTAGYAS